MINRRFIGKIGDQVAYLYRIDKRKAKAFFNTGTTVYLVPSNFVPFGPWIQPCPIKKDSPCGWSNEFETICKEFEYYNCINSQTGYFPAYYVDLFESNLKFPKNEIHI
jgi:hypothetical protein